MRRRLRPWVKIVMGVSSLCTTALLGTKMPVSDVLPDPDHSASESYVLEAEEEPKTLAEWKEINPKVKYVLSFQDDGIQRVIPVICTPDAAYALKHDIYGDYDTMGSVFCDPCNGDPVNLVIYGHASKTKDWGFTFLKHYLNRPYYERFPSFQLESASGMIPCRILSAGVYDMESEETVLSWADPDPGSAEEVTAMIRETMPYLKQRTDGLVYEGSGLVTLVTCDMTAPDARIVIQAMRNAS